MAQLIAAAVATIVGVAFVMSNAHDVELSCVLGPPLRVRLIILLGAAYLGGLLTAWFLRMARNASRQAEQRRLQHLAKRAAMSDELEAE